MIYICFILYTLFSIDDEIGFMMGNTSYQTPSFSVLPLIATKTLNALKRSAVCDWGFGMVLDMSTTRGRVEGI